MLLMLRLLTIVFLLGSSAFATSDEDRIESFLKKSFKDNRNIVSLKIKVVDKIKLEEIKGWNAFIVNIDATVKSKPKNRQVKQKTVWFSNGSLITQDLVDMKSGISLRELIRPKIKSEYYKKENLIYGNADAKHKVAIFSDPLCPFCRRFVPRAVKMMKEQPEDFAVYYYHFPLSSLHPASVDLVKATIAAELKGAKNVILNLYKIRLNSRQSDTKKILEAFNNVMKTDIKPSDLNSSEVMKRYNTDINIANELMLHGTPSVFFDNELDKSRKKYKRYIK